jgi:hypothetical protein
VTNTAVTTADPPDVHGPDCIGVCSRWVGLGTRTCLPTPCQCNTYRASKPAWGRERCWWIKRNTDRTVSACPCWGRKRADSLPAACCSWHPANPHYAPPPPRTADDLDVAPLLDDWDRPGPRVDVGQLDWNNFDPEVEHSPYARRWKPEELTCGCATPWDGVKAARGWHCSGEGCHANFKSYAVGEVHRRRWTEPCRAPETIRDVDTGHPLMYQGADGVWGPLYPTE